MRQTQLKAAIDQEQYDRAHQISGKIKEIIAREIDKLAKQVGCWVHRLSFYDSSSLPALFPRTLRLSTMSAVPILIIRKTRQLIKAARNLPPNLPGTRLEKMEVLQ